MGIKYKLPFPEDVEYQRVDDVHTHKGIDEHAIDFILPIGTPVLAARAGTIAAIKQDSDIGGNDESLADKANYVAIDHGDDTFAMYVHLKQCSVPVKIGDKVEQGQKIGEVGNTGYSTQPHLHFSVRKITSIKVDF
jgi:murein DD-endopeptidase MepM/ murein hydrolase activator NlpD